MAQANIRGCQSTIPDQQLCRCLSVFARLSSVSQTESVVQVVLVSHFLSGQCRLAPYRLLLLVSGRVKIIITSHRGRIVNRNQMKIDWNERMEGTELDRTKISISDSGLMGWNRDNCGKVIE